MTRTDKHGLRGVTVGDVLALAALSGLTVLVLVWLCLSEWARGVGG